MNRRSLITSLISDNYNLNTNEKAQYNESLEFLIKLNLTATNYSDILKAVDLSLIILNDNKLLKKITKNKKNFKNYYLGELISREIIYLPKIFTNIDNKISNRKLNLLKYFQRKAKDKKNYFEVFFLCLKKLNIISKIIDDDSGDNDLPNIDISENNIPKKHKDIKKKKIDYIQNVLTIDEVKDLDVVKDVCSGNFSKVFFLKLTDELKCKIENTILEPTDDIIVKKKFIPNDNFDCDINDMFNKEIQCLKLLFGLAHFPHLLCYDSKNKDIYLNYCGESLNDDNIPNDWKNQADNILDSLEKSNIYNNDMWINNVLVHKNILYVIDFGFGSFYKEEFPYINLNKDMINQSVDLIELLDNAMTSSIEKRLIDYLN